MLPLIEAGFTWYLPRPLPESRLPDVCSALVALKATHGTAIPSRPEIAARMERLTPRQKEVVAQLYAGRSNKEAARQLDCSPRTIEIHRRAIFRTLHADSYATLIKMIARILG